VRRYLVLLLEDDAENEEIEVFYTEDLNEGERQIVRRDIEVRCKRSDERALIPGASLKSRWTTYSSPPSRSRSPDPASPSSPARAEV
jgi:hypothetical protein